VDNKVADNPISKTATLAPEVLAAPLPGDVKPSVSDAAAPATKLTSTAPPTMAAVAGRAAPTGPKSNRVTPAVPMTVNQKSFVPPATSNGPLSSSTGNQPAAKAAPTAVSMEEASRQAKEAVAAAMAKLNGGAAATTKPAGPASSAMDALAKKVGEMRTHDGGSRGRALFRGGRGNFRGAPSGQPTKKIEIPKDDYDFESANAKFNKEDMVKEAIASGSPLAETAGEDPNGIEDASATNGETRKDGPASAQAYNKTSSFFDNISSESKDRQEAQEERVNGRQMRSEEYKKNLDTFGQGNVDGGGYRGRGRGRGFRGGFNRGYSRGYGGGGRGGFEAGFQRGRGRGGANVSTS
jgi:protein LSM14